MFVLSHFLQELGLKVVVLQEFEYFFAFGSDLKVKFININLSINVDLFLFFVLDFKP